MMLWRIAAAGLWVATASVTAAGQQSDVRTGPWPATPAESSILRTYPGGEFLPSRAVESRHQVDGVEVVTKIIETPNVERRLTPAEEVTTKTVRAQPNVAHSRRDVFGFDQSGRRMLSETTESEERVLPDGTIEIVRNTRAPGVTGYLVVTSREIERTRSVSPDTRETDISVFTPGINVPMQETRRVHRTERQLGPGRWRRETTFFILDVNGRFQPFETRSQDITAAGPALSREEETIQRLDDDTRLTLDERKVTVRSTANGQEHTLIETFSKNGEGAVRPDLKLSQRVRRTTTRAPEGGGRTIEDVEAIQLSAPGEPLTLMQRSVETTRSVGDQRWQMQRDVLQRDVNEVLAPYVRETGIATGGGATK